VEIRPVRLIWKSHLNEPGPNEVKKHRILLAETELNVNKRAGSSPASPIVILANPILSPYHQGFPTTFDSCFLLQTSSASFVSPFFPNAFPPPHGPTAQVEHALAPPAARP
jgi:hypothetical protein